MAVRALVILVGECWQSKDAKMIVSDDELAEILMTSPKVIRETMNLLIAEKLIERLVRGSALRGRPRICSQYVLGTAFEGVPPMMRGKDKGKPYPKAQRGDSTTPLGKGTTGALQHPKGGECATPSPICTLNTHTKESPLAFTMKNWIAYTENPALFPGWTREDRERCFDLAKRKGYETDETWRGCCAFYFKQWQRHNAKPQAPAATIAQRHFTPAPRPAVRSSCESPKTAPLDYASRQLLETELQTAIKEGLSLEFIKASAPKALYDSVIASIYAKKGLGVAA